MEGFDLSDAADGPTSKSGKRFIETAESTAPCPVRCSLVQVERRSAQNGESVTRQKLVDGREIVSKQRRTI